MAKREKISFAWTGGSKQISPHLSAHDVVLYRTLTSSSRRGGFATECEVAGMRISTSKFEVVVLRGGRGGVLTERRSRGCCSHVR